GPEVLLLDEPLSALDARLRERLRVTIRDIQQDLDITTVYVTHDQAEALAISDRVAVVNDGRIEQVDTPEMVYRKPASRFVAEFVGENNLFRGDVRSTTPPRASVNGVDVNLPETASVTAGETVLFAVRPESIRLDGGETTLTARVENCEFLGDAYRVHCTWNDQSILVKADSRNPPDRTVELGINADDIHLLTGK
ncbi:MAG TPA: ABC transporter ATP-binding protein, partial [Halococcus sp.]|nr:ABC transporter ATP-binding protein [Halococcus sp.]